MLFPDYLNKIINFQLKNKQIEQVRAEITKLVSTSKQKKDNNASIIDDNTNKKHQISKTMTNFFNVHSLNRQKQQKIDPRKTFSEMHIDRLKKRLTIQQQNRNNFEAHTPQDPNMNEWRLEILKHLKPPPIKKTVFQPKQQSHVKQIGRQENYKLIKLQSKMKPIKITKAASTPLIRKFQRKQNPKYEEAIKNNNQVSSQRNIILIRPQPVLQEQIEEKSVSKFKWAAFKQKRASKKAETQEDEFTVQRLANFTALLPYLGTQKAKVQPRQQKKARIAEQMITQQRLQYPYQKKIKKIPEQAIQITGWDILQD